MKNIKPVKLAMLLIALVTIVGVICETVIEVMNQKNGKIYYVYILLNAVGNSYIRIFWNIVADVKPFYARNCVSRFCLG